MPPTSFLYHWHLHKAGLENAAGADCLSRAETAFGIFCKEAVERKKAVSTGEADNREFEPWLLRQRGVIDKILLR